MIEEIKKVLEKQGGIWEEKKGVWEFTKVIAERKAFLSKKTLTYSARFKINETDKTITFSEMLKESGLGVSSGGGFDSEMSPGFGFKKETYNTFSGAREGTIEESSTLFGKKYQYTFDYKEIRALVERTSKEAGFSFDYQILPVR